MIRCRKIAIERVEIVILCKVFTLLCFVILWGASATYFLAKDTVQFLKKKKGFLSSSSITVYKEERCKINTLILDTRKNVHVRWAKGHKRVFAILRKKLQSGDD